MGPQVHTKFQRNRNRTRNISDMGLPTEEDRLSIGLTVPEIYASQKRGHGRPAGRRAAHTHIFSVYQ